MDEVIVKPFTANDLLKAMELAIGKRGGIMIAESRETASGASPKLPAKVKMKTAKTLAQNEQQAEKKPTTSGNGSAPRAKSASPSLSIQGIKDPAVVLRMFSIFENNASSTLNRFEKGLADKDWNEVAEAAHKMIPALRHLGAEELVEGFRAVEKKCDAQSELETIPGDVGYLTEELKSFLKKVAAERNRLETTVSGS